MSTIFLQHFCDKSSVTSCYLLLLVSKKSNFSGEFKLESITNFPLKKKKNKLLIPCFYYHNSQQSWKFVNDLVYLK